MAFIPRQRRLRDVSAHRTIAWSWLRTLLFLGLPRIAIGSTAPLARLRALASERDISGAGPTYVPLNASSFDRLMVDCQGFADAILGPVVRAEYCTIPACAATETSTTTTSTTWTPATTWLTTSTAGALPHGLAAAPATTPASTAASAVGTSSSPSPSSASAGATKASTATTTAAPAARSDADSTRREVEQRVDGGTAAHATYFRTTSATATSTSSATLTTTAAVCSVVGCCDAVSIPHPCGGLTAASNPCLEELNVAGAPLAYNSYALGHPANQSTCPPISSMPRIFRVTCCVCAVPPRFADADPARGSLKGRLSFGPSRDTRGSIDETHVSGYRVFLVGEGRRRLTTAPVAQVGSYRRGTSGISPECCDAGRYSVELDVRLGLAEGVGPVRFMVVPISKGLDLVLGSATDPVVDLGAAVRGSLLLSVSRPEAFVLDGGAAAVVRRGVAEVVGVPVDTVNVTLDLVANSFFRRLLAASGARRLQANSEVEAQYAVLSEAGAASDHIASILRAGLLTQLSAAIQGKITVPEYFPVVVFAVRVDEVVNVTRPSSSPFASLPAIPRLRREAAAAAAAAAVATVLGPALCCCLGRALRPAGVKYEAVPTKDVLEQASRLRRAVEAMLRCWRRRAPPTKGRGVPALDLAGAAARAWPTAELEAETDPLLPVGLKAPTALTTQPLTTQPLAPPAGAPAGAFAGPAGPCGLPRPTLAPLQALGAPVEWMGPARLRQPLGPAAPPLPHCVAPFAPPA